MNNTKNQNDSPLSTEEMQSLSKLLFGVSPIHVPIPSIFYNSVTQKPYSNCLICGQSLENQSYRINKVFRQFPEFGVTETMIEMAICEKCVHDPIFKISKDSEIVIMNFFNQIDFLGRALEISQSEEANNPEKWIERCIITDLQRSELTDYQIMGKVSADGKLVLDAELFMMSGQAIEKLSEQLSPETRQDLEDFTGKYFGIPPELLPEDQPKLILV